MKKEYLIYYIEAKDYVLSRKVLGRGYEGVFTNNINEAKVFNTKNDAIKYLEEIYDADFKNGSTIIGTKQEMMIREIIT